MKCPFRFKEFTSNESTQDCVLDCAMLRKIRLEVTDTHTRDVYACGFMGKYDEAAIPNKAYGEWKKRGSQGS